MASLTDSPLIRQEGKHYKFDDIEYWAEEGVICIIDTRDGQCNAVTCKDFALRAATINEQARRATYVVDKRRLQDIVLDMHEAWKEAKKQGDPSDLEVIKKKLKERKRAILVTGMW